MNKEFKIKMDKTNKLILNENSYLELSYLNNREYFYFSIKNKWGNYDNIQINYNPEFYKELGFKIQWAISENLEYKKEILKYKKQIKEFYLNNKVVD